MSFFSRTKPADKLIAAVIILCFLITPGLLPTAHASAGKIDSEVLNSRAVSNPYLDNGDNAQTTLQVPAFSVTPGFYENTVNLELKHPDSLAIIYYTLDGSYPDTSSLVYSVPLKLESRVDDPNRLSVIRTTPPEGDQYEPFSYGWMQPLNTVDKAHIIRTRAFYPDKPPSEIVTGSWFIGLDQQHLPVLSLAAPDSAFFGYHEGIYVPGAIYNSIGFGTDPWGRDGANYHQRGVEWERETSLEWFEDGTRIFQQDIGVRIHGGGSRAVPMKSLRLYARNLYGQSRFEHQIFQDQPYKTYKRLILRNSGQDFFWRATMLRDVFMQDLVRDLNVTTQASRPAVVFLNGEYWGLHNIRERYDKHFIERVFRVPENRLDYLTQRGTSARHIKEGTNAHYVQLLNYIDQATSSGQSITPAQLAYISDRMDLDNYIDLLILNIFFSNYDWPGNNIDFWRYRGVPDQRVPEHDGRWRWIVFDLDFGFGMFDGEESWKRDMILHATESDQDNSVWSNRPWATFLIRSLMTNEEFRVRFLFFRSAIAT